MTLLIATLLVLGILGLGTIFLAVLRRLDPVGAPDPGLETTLAFGLGIVALSTAAFLLGLARALRPVPLAALLAAGAAVALFCLGRTRPDFRALATGLGHLDQALVALVALLAVVAFVSAISPPTAWDALAYHLGMAKRFAAAGGFVDLPTIRQARWPLGLDSLFAVAESLGGTAISGVTAFFLSLLSTGAAASLGRTQGGNSGGVLAAALFSGAPLVALLQGTAYLEAGLAALVTLALVAALRHAEGGRRSHLLAAGLLAGSAAAVKYTALVVPPLVAGVVVLTTGRARRGLVVLAAALAAAFPWYVRTWVLSGSPLWPYAYGTLGGRDWDAAHAARLFAFERSFRDNATLGPAFLALLPLALIRPTRGRLALLGFAGLWAVAWALTMRQIRFLVPLLPAVAAAVAGGAAMGTWPRTTRAARAGALAVAATSLVLLAPPLPERLSVLMGLEPREAYLARHLSSFEAMRFANNVLRPRCLLLFREVRGYTLDVPYLWGDPLNQALVDYASLPDPESLHHRLRDLGIDAVLVNGREYAPTEAYYDARTVAIMEATLKRWGEVVWDSDGVRVVRLR